MRSMRSMRPRIARPFNGSGQSAGNRAVTLPITANLVQVVLHGGFPPATRGNPRPYGMPPFATTLSDAEVAAVLTYVRSSWGNKAAPVDDLRVAQQRGSR